MKVKDIMRECLVKMGRENFLDKEQKSEEENALASGLLSSLSAVYRELTTCDFPVTTSEEVRFSGGVLRADSIKKAILYPISLTVGGNSVEYTAYHDRIEANVEGTATLKYAYDPESDFGIGDSIADIRMSVGLLSDGTLANYYLANKIYKLAEAFDSAFRSKLTLARYKGRPLYLKYRGW